MNIIEHKNIKLEKRGKAGYVIKRIIAVIAILNLVCLFVFDYQVPGFSRLITYIESSRNTGTPIIYASEDGENALNEDNGILISFDEDTIQYNGKGKLDLLQGIDVIDSAGNILNNDNLQENITSQGNKKKKTITYIYKDDQGNQAQAERYLKLVDYEGPSIVLKKDLSALQDGDLDHLLVSYKGSILALDGFGKNITSKVEISANVTADYSGKFVLTFEVLNAYGDRTTVQREVETNFMRPHLSLLKSDISLKKGDQFTPQDYIKYAVDEEGQDISKLVKISGKVNTGKTGTYKVVYNLTDRKGYQVKEKVLKVHVAEN